MSLLNETGRDVAGGSLVMSGAAAWAGIAATSGARQEAMPTRRRKSSGRIGARSGDMEARGRFTAVGSVEHLGMEVGAVDGGMAAGRPAGTEGEQGFVVHLSDPQFTGALLDLGVAFQAQVRVAFGEHFGVHRAVGAVAGDAALPIRLVFEDEGAGLLPMARAALFVQLGHAEAAGRLEDFAPMRVVALDAVHLAFDHRMMLRQAELHLDILVAAVTPLGIFARIEDQTRSAAGGFGVEAAGAVAAFTTGAAGELLDIRPHPEMDVALEGPRIIGVTVVTLVVADQGRARDLRGDDHAALNGRAGAQESNQHGSQSQQGAADRPTFRKFGCHRFRSRSRPSTSSETLAGRLLFREMPEVCTGVRVGVATRFMKGTCEGPLWRTWRQSATSQSAARPPHAGSVQDGRKATAMGRGRLERIVQGIGRAMSTQPVPFRSTAKD